MTSLPSPTWPRWTAPLHRRERCCWRRWASELWAAIEVDSGAAIADPFRPSGDVVELLRFRAERARGEAAHGAPQRVAPAAAGRIAGRDEPAGRASRIDEGCAPSRCSPPWRRLALASCGEGMRAEPRARARSVLRFTVPRLNGEPDDLSRLPRRGRARGQHGQRVRLHAAVRGPRAPLRRAPPGRLRDPRLSRKRLRRSGAALERRRSPSSAGRTSACRSRCSPSSA